MKNSSNQTEAGVTRSNKHVINNAYENREVYVEVVGLLQVRTIGHGIIFFGDKLMQ